MTMLATPFQPRRLAVLYVMPQGWRYFESRTEELDELEAAFWAPAPAQRNLDQQAGWRLTRAMGSGEIAGVVLVGSADDRARLVSLLPERVRAKVAARLDPPHPWPSRQELSALVRQVAPPTAKG